MKKRKTISFIIVYLGCFYHTFAQNNKIKTLPKSIYFSSLKKVDSTNYFNVYKYTENIKQQLKNVNLVIYNSNEIKGGKFIFSTDYFGKPFFKDYYIVYKDDLSKHLSKPLDMSKLY